jgi:hypothetical protein
MSLNQTLTKTINEVIQTFITKVSDKYNIDNDDLKILWNGNIVKSDKIITPVINNPIQPTSDIDYEVLLKCNKAELTAMCKAHGHKCSGTKSILMNRLLGKNENDSPKTEKKSITKKTKSSQQEAVKATPVVKKLTANIPNILIRRNQYNNYEHPETGLIFNNDTKIVIGKQNDDGSVDPLTEEDIDKCNAFKFKFKIPIDLDSKATLVDVKVDELDEEEEEEEELEEEEEEEEMVLEEEEEEEVLEEDLLEDDDILEDDEEYEDYESDE